MKRLAKSRLLGRLGRWGLGLALGLSAAHAQAGDVEWRPVKKTAPVTLETPRPILRTEFASDGRAPVFRAQTGEQPKMLPVGPENGKGAPKPPEPIGPPVGSGIMVPGSTRVVPMPAVISSGPAIHASPTVVGSPTYVVEGTVVDGSCATAPCDAGGWTWFGGLRRGGGCRGDGWDRCFWLNGEYLLWWMKGANTPPLVTQGSPADAFPGALGQVGTQVLFGGDSVKNEVQSGFRMRGGYWFDDCQNFGVDGGFFFLGQREVMFAAGSEGSPALFRPFFNQDLGVNDAQFVAFPDPLLTTGTVTVSLTSRAWGADANFRTNLVRSCWAKVDGLVGFRYFGLDDTLNIMENVTQRFGLDANGNPVPADPNNFVVNDRFQARNRFYGGQVGLEAELRRGNWSLDLRGKVGLGNVHQIVTVGGSTLITPAGGASTLQPGGLLAQPSNIGRYSRDRFAVLPEVGVNLGYQVTNHLRVFAGYNFLYLSNVVRASDQIDTALNVSQIPRVGGAAGAAGLRPMFAFKDSDFWLHGVNFGLEFRY